MNHEKARRPSSLCWYCANAVPSDVTGCPWSRDFDEVEGWEAICTDHLHRNEIGADSIAHGKHAYLVKECPMYLPDSKEYIKEHMKYDEGLNALALSVIKIGVIDLIAAYRHYLQTAYRRGDRYVIIDNIIMPLYGYTPQNGFVKFTSLNSFLKSSSMFSHGENSFSRSSIC